ncbi:colicin immunity domain-containing protein [Priestia aryabhattai]|uniref:colicin immunity domain-containing protein n=1 Tax=Priestia aryabhattai TaxID=412384 RepID=UPI0039821E0A
MLVDKCKQLIEEFLNEKITADEFQDQYIKTFKKSNEKLSNGLFVILNDVFESADCYWHECLPGQETSFEISKQELRKEVTIGLTKLQELESQK